MAKKKVSHSHPEKPQQKQKQKQEEPIKPLRETMDSDVSEKLDSLKSLNQILLKETVERRQLVESLTHSKGSLETELTRSNSEKEALRAELTQLSDRVMHLELEKTVVSVFVELQVHQQVGLMGENINGLESEISELGRVIESKERVIVSLNEKLSEVEAALQRERGDSERAGVERDEMKRTLELQIKEANGLSESLRKLESEKREIQREIEKLRIEYTVMVEEKEQKEKTIELMMEDKDLMERRLWDSNKLNEEMKRKIQDITREKEEIEEEKNLEVVKIMELESEVSRLKQVLMSWQKEEESLRMSVDELEKRCLEGIEKEKEMGEMIEGLLEGKERTEKQLEGLMKEKDMVVKGMDVALGELDEKRKQLENMVNEKTVMVEAKDRLASEIMVLQDQVAKFKAAVLELEDSIQGQAGKITELESEVQNSRSVLELVKVERDGVRKSLDEEKFNLLMMKEKIEEMEKKIEESLKTAEEAKAENVKITGEKNELECQCEVLSKEVTSLEKQLVEAQGEFNAIRGRVEMADANSELLLNMLRDTAGFCSKGEIDAVDGSFLDDDEQMNGEELKQYVVELVMIRNAFKNKDTKAESMKKQLELLQNSMVEEHKKKGFWTLFSSLTTLLAAASLAYIARGR